MTPDFSLVEAYTSKTTGFKFRGLELRFALSHGLFSSAGVDRGTALLLRVLSRVWDEDRAAGRPPPRRILDAGCGAGIIAVCAAAALQNIPGGWTGTRGAGDAGSPEFYLRAQDRDELARLFTGYNARINGVDSECFSAHTEALLSSPPGSRWDLILSNIPAKAGRPVLEDFVHRSIRLLNPGGKVLIVAVNTLADFFRSQISGAGGRLVREGAAAQGAAAQRAGAEHTVFVYAAGPGAEGEIAAGEQPRSRPGGAAGAETPGVETVRAGAGFLEANPFYRRQTADCELEGVPLRLDTIHGAPGFDRPGGAVEAAAKLTRRLGPPARPAGEAAAPSVLIHEPDQGWFPRWLLAFPGQSSPVTELVLSGRNILALEAARHNALQARPPARAAGETAAGPVLSVIPMVELSPRGLADFTENSGAPAGRFGFIAAFPETVPRTDRRDALWEGLAALLAPGGLAVVSLPASEAERFDRKKPPGFCRRGDLKRKGFRALAYEKK
ncbi:MAG: methyltransferase [Treponema sp.]|nr:methyltransferase [Treponema sp.]